MQLKNNYKTQIGFWLGWLGNTFLILGLILAGQKHWTAFLFTALGELYWCIKLIFYTKNKDTAMLFICILFFLLACYNFYSWTFTP